MKTHLPMIERVTAPVDPVLFLEMSKVFQEAAQRPLPTPDKRKPGPYLTDIPLNRGMLGVMSALRKQGGNPDSEAYLFRLMHLGEILEARERFAEFIRGADDSESIDISEALLMAAAVARIMPSDDRASFDLDDVLLHARRFDDEGAANKDRSN